jgi:Fe-S oxidoreductase
LCCGSAGTYNILEPEIAARLRDRKIANIVQTSPDLVATGNRLHRADRVRHIDPGAPYDRTS